MQSTDHWTVTSVSLFGNEFSINKHKYIFGNYKLGRGAFGTVYPARRANDGKNVAIKVVSIAENSSSLPYLIESFLNEVRLSLKLSSESKHVVKIFDFDFDQSGLAFIVMERGGLDLEKALQHKPILSIRRQKLLWRQILDIIITLHHHSLVHLDLKPSNLVFFGDQLKLVDLGIAQRANTKRKGPNGTYGFSAPEVVLDSHHAPSHYTYKADIWSVGGILYWLNYGASPEYNNRRGCYHPPSGIRSSKDRNLVDILRHTLRMDYHRRPNHNWLLHHPFTRLF